MPFKDLETKREWYRRRKKQRKQECREYLGGKCVGCGATENLQFDHIDRTQKSFIISSNVTMNWDKLTEELDKCQLLCDTCHRLKTTACYDNQLLYEGYKVSSIDKVGDDYIVRLSPM